jgi:hypothetical protein
MGRISVAITNFLAPTNVTSTRSGRSMVSGPAIPRHPASCSKRSLAWFDEQSRYAETWVRALGSLQMRKAGLLSKHYWLKSVRRTLWPPT